MLTLFFFPDGGQEGGQEAHHPIFHLTIAVFERIQKPRIIDDDDDDDHAGHLDVMTHHYLHHPMTPLHLLNQSLLLMRTQMNLLPAQLYLLPAQMYLLLETSHLSLFQCDASWV